MSLEPIDAPLIIEKLARHHELDEFDCGNTTLNTWLARFALTNQKAETTRTYVAHRDGRVVGYHSLVAGSVRKDEVTPRMAQGIANHPVGVILLARLAVAKNEHGRGLGKATSAGRTRENRLGGRLDRGQRRTRACNRRCRKVVLRSSRFPSLTA